MQEGKTIEIKIPKEIREYQESIFFGLSTRQFICSLLSLGIAVGLYFFLRGPLGGEMAGWMCMLGAAPFAACGFVRYHGMTAEQVLWAFIRSELLTPRKLVFRAVNLYYDAMRATVKRSVKQICCERTEGCR